MKRRSVLDALLVGWFALAAVFCHILFFVTVPYGRHTRCGRGPRLDSRLGWTLMEAPSAVTFAVYFVLSEHGRPATRRAFHPGSF